MSTTTGEWTQEYAKSLIEHHSDDLAAHMVKTAHNAELAAKRRALEHENNLHVQAAETARQLREQLAAEREEKQRLIEHIDNVAADHKQQLAAAVEALNEIATTGADVLDGYDAANIADAALAKIGGK